VILLHPGDLFGSLAESGTESFGESMRTLTSACIARVSLGRFEQIARRHPELGFRLARAGLEQLQRVHLHLAEQMSKPADRRLALALLEIDRVFSEDTIDASECGVSHQDLAELIGTTREMVTHILGRFRKKGWVEIRRRQIDIRDRESLQELAEA
jgi:CRP-like cAMP-binding protein